MTLVVGGSKQTQGLDAVLTHSPAPGSTAWAAGTLPCCWGMAWAGPSLLTALQGPRAFAEEPVWSHRLHPAQGNCINTPEMISQVKIKILAEEVQKCFIPSENLGVVDQ